MCEMHCNMQEGIKDGCRLRLGGLGFYLQYWKLESWILNSTLTDVKDRPSYTMLFSGFQLNIVTLGTQRRSRYFINFWGWRGEWGVGVCGGGGGSLTSEKWLFLSGWTRLSGASIQTQDFWEKRKLEWRVKVVIFFKNRACDIDFCRSRRIGIDFYAVKVKKHRAIYSYITENRR